jgi:hypothetical protein
MSKSRAFTTFSKASGLDVNVEVEGLHHFFFGSKFAKAWYEEFRDPEYLPYHFDDEIRRMDDKWIEGFFERVMSRLDETDHEQSG